MKNNSINAVLLMVSASIPVLAMTYPVDRDSTQSETVIPVAIENGQPTHGWKPTPFVNFESPHVSPMDITPDGSRVLVVNTPDNQPALSFE